MTLPDYHLAVTLMTGIALLISVSEHFFNWRQLGRHGTYNWPLLRESWWGRTKSSTLNRIFDICFSPPAFLALLGTQTLAVIVMMVSTFNDSPSSLALGLVVGTNLIVNYRNRISLDGSDQMVSILIVSLFFYSLFPGSELIRSICLWFVALQSCLTYFTAGISKAWAAKWQSGSAVSGAAVLSAYGVKPLTRVLNEWPRLGKVLSWSLVVMQCIFPCALIVGAPLGFLFLAGGVLFHLMNAVFLGLNRFFWAFVATYPAILYCMAQVREWLTG